jgi:hypothetical protein
MNSQLQSTRMLMPKMCPMLKPRSMFLSLTLPRRSHSHAGALMAAPPGPFAGSGARLRTKSVSPQHLAQSLRDVGRDVGNAPGIGPFIVVPRQYLDGVVPDNHRGLGIDDGRVVRCR